jgi:DNA polymerase
MNGNEVAFIPTYHPAACIYNSGSKEDLKMTIRIVKDRYLS